MYNLEFYDGGKWHVVFCAPRHHEVCQYFAKEILACNPDSQLVIVKA